MVSPLVIASEAWQSWGYGIVELVPNTSEESRSELASAMPSQPLVLLAMTDKAWTRLWSLTCWRKCYGV
jgi:hypothetical protein